MAIQNNVIHLSQTRNSWMMWTVRKMCEYEWEKKALKDEKIHSYQIKKMLRKEYWLQWYMNNGW